MSWSSMSLKRAIPQCRASRVGRLRCSLGILWWGCKCCCTPEKVTIVDRGLELQGRSKLYWGSHLSSSSKLHAIVIILNSSHLVFVLLCMPASRLTITIEKIVGVWRKPFSGVSVTIEHPTPHETTGFERRKQCPEKFLPFMNRIMNGNPTIAAAEFGERWVCWLFVFFRDVDACMLQPFF